MGEVLCIPLAVNGKFFLQQDVPLIQLFCHCHEGHACGGIIMNEGVLNG